MYSSLIHNSSNLLLVDLNSRFHLQILAFKFLLVKMNLNFPIIVLRAGFKVLELFNLIKFVGLALFNVLCI